VYVKDLRIFLKPTHKYNSWCESEIIMIDNASHSFGAQINNGIPILPFYDDKDDKELLHIYHFLYKLAYL